MKFNGSFGDWLKQRRKALDLTQQDVADQVGCAVVTVRKIEAEVSRPSKQIAERLAEVLAVALEDRAVFVSFARHMTDSSPALPLELPAPIGTSDLPPQMTPFIGRGRELAHLAERLSDPHCRLVTLVGPGGIGKTRLALEAAHDHRATFAHGVYFVSLAPVSSADLLISAVGSALKFPFYGQEPPAVQLLNYLRQKAMLLVLDNFEHLLEGTPLLVDLLAGAPHLKLLVTSRERLNVQSEWVIQVEGMDYPLAEMPDPLDSYGTVQLFVQSAQRVQADFSLASDEAGVLRICQLVEGMPLGIILATAWVGTLSTQEIAEEIQHSLDFLETDQRDVPPRLRSLRAAFDYSWRLLTDDEREVFGRLSVFRGGFTRDAAHLVAGASVKTLKALAEKSFLRRDAATGRYDIHELLRQYGEAQLTNDVGEREHVRDIHCAYYAQYLQRQSTPLMSRQQAAVLADIGIEFNNIRAAWDFAVETGKATIFRAMTPSLWFFCDLQIPHQDAVDLFGRAAIVLQSLPIENENENEIALGLMLAIQAWFLTVIPSLLLQAKALVERSLVILRQYECPQEMVLALVTLANLASIPLRQFAEGEQAAKEGLRIAQECHTLWGSGACLLQLSISSRLQGKLIQARQAAEQALQLGRSTGDVFVMACAYELVGGISRLLGSYSEAERYLEQAYQLYLEIEPEKPYHAGNACVYLGRVAILTRDYSAAKSWLQTAFACYEKTGLSFEKTGPQNEQSYEALIELGRLWTAQGNIENALTLYSQLESGTPYQYLREAALLALDDLQAKVPQAVYTAAVVRGRALDLGAVVAEFLAA